MSEIRKEQIAEKDVLKNLIPTSQQIQLIEKMNTELKESARIAKENLGSGSTTKVSEIKKQQKAQQDLNKVTKQKSVLDKEKLKLDQRLKKEKAGLSLANTKEAKELARLRDEKNKVNKATRDEIKQNERNKNAYTKLSDASRNYKNESKRLGAELLALEQSGQKNSRVWSETNKRYTQVTAKAKTTDAQLKKLDATVGDNQRSVGNYANATRKLTSALGSLGIAVGVGAIFRKVGGIVANFDQAVTDLGAISGKTAEELAPLNKQARELGATTQFSATEVTGLQIELAKLGFTTQEIMDSTGGIANFAAATGVEIPRAASLAGSAMRAFGLEASEIDRVVSTLGVATTKTALDFSKLEAGLSTVAPVAASFGFSIEDTTAVLGQLANAGFDASSAATATRNILLNLADSGGSLAKELGRPVKNAEDLAKGLQELDARGIDLAQALELTDKRSVAAFSTFIQGSKDLVGLRDSITDVNDELKAMADKRIQSVGGAMKILNSAFEEQVLGFNEATGASDKFQASIKFVAENLGTIIKVIAKFAALLLIIKARQKIINSGMIDYAKNLFKAKGAQNDLNKSMSKGGGSAKGFGKALKGIGWAALIGVAIELAVAFYDIASGAAEARRKAKELDDYKAAADKQSTKAVDNYNKEYEKRLFNINEEERVLKSKAKTQEEVDKIALDALEKRQKAAVKQTKIFNSLNNQAQEKIDKDLKSIEVLEKLDVSNGQILGGSEELAKQLREAGFENAKYNSTWASINITVDEAIKRKSKLTAKVEAARVRQENYTAALEESKDLLTTVTNDIVVDSNERSNNRDKINAQVKGLKDQNDELERQKLNLKDIDALLNEGKTLEEIEDEEISQENDRIERELQERLTMINDAERDRTLTEEEAQDQRVLMELESALEKREILKFYGRDLVEIDKEISELRLDVSKWFNDKEVKTEEDKNKSMLELASEMQDQITNVISQNVDKRIALLDKEAEASRKQQDYLKGLATEGNIDAKESIKEEIENETEALKRKEQLEQQKRALQLVSSGLTTFNQQIENGASPGEALAKTVTTSKALVDFLSQLSFFAEGTDNAPQGKAVVDEEGAEIIADKYGKIKEIGSNKGARMVDLSRGDRVITAPETSALLSQMGSVDNFARQKVDNGGNSYDLMMLNKLGSIENAIKNQPQTNTGYDKALGEVVSEFRGNGQRRINRYRTR